MKKSLIILSAITLGIFLLVMFVTFIAVRISSSEGRLNIAKRDSIGVIEIKGIIDDSKQIINEIVRFRKDKDVKAILLRIDSPGGGVGPSQEIYEEIKRTKEVKKVVASLGSVAASGAYYIACASDLIVSNPGTITGSIGVIMEFLNIEDLTNKIGVKQKVIKSGKFKDVGSMTREMTQEEKEILQKVIDNVYDQFVEAIVEGRNLLKEDVIKIADGRIFTGEQAKELELVDEIGNFQRAIELSSQLVGIKGEPNLIYPKKPKPSIFDMLKEPTETISNLKNLVIPQPFKLSYILN